MPFMADEKKTAAPDKRRFEFKQCLGSGGFGEVYLARMTSASGVQSDVAVKLLHQGLDPISQSLRRLRDEGRLLGVLNHPGILRVIDLVLLEEQVALVTEYLQGCDLAACFKTGAMPVRALVEVIGRVADALYAAYHAPSPKGGPLKLIHRDVKPANIWIGRHGDVKLLDFGVARATNVKREAKTQTSMLIGSYIYMAPERFDTDNELDLPGDVYSLGCTLFRGLSHRHLLRNLELKQQYLFSQKPKRYAAFIKERLDSLPRTVPAPVFELLKSMVDHDPANRPAAADLARRCEELAEDLDGLSLRRWCRTYEWPNTPDLGGSLDGQVITETSLTGTPISTVTKDKRLVIGLETSEELPKPTSQSRILLMGVLAILMLGSAMLVGVVVLAFVSQWLVPNQLGVADVHVEPPTLEDPPALVDFVPLEPDPDDKEVPDEPAPPPVVELPHTLMPLPKPIPVVAESDRSAVEEEVEEVPVESPETEAEAEVVAEETKSPDRLYGSFRVDGTTKVELRGGGAVYSAGVLPLGIYEIWADFGQGQKKVGLVDINGVEPVTIKCNRLRLDCAEVK
ncbi:MAG: serine/threonine protein kinase [Proteobacteria bacterium]|nr:serine/threonine protein kinase [Pseudomonadota bacterium]